jgi:hypothetical protein
VVEAVHLIIIPALLLMEVQEVVPLVEAIQQ